MPFPRDHLGRILSRACPDHACDGTMVADCEEFGRRHWRYDGLTHAGETDPLFACTTSHVDGERVAA